MKALQLNPFEKVIVKTAEEEQQIFVYAVGQKYQFQIPLN